MRRHLDLNHKAFTIFLTTAAFILFLCFYLLQSKPIDPNYVTQRAQVKLAQTSSYRFELSVQTVIDGQDKKVAAVSGEFLQPNTYHLKGSSYDYDLELYHVNSQLFFFDPADKRWKRASAAPSLVTEAVLFTTSPIADFLAAREFTLITRQRLHGQSVYQLGAKLDCIANPYWEIFFNDFYLESWIEYPSCRVKQLQLIGSNNGSDENRLTATLMLTDYDQPVQITLPVGISE